MNLDIQMEDLIVLHSVWDSHGEIQSLAGQSGAQGRGDADCDQTAPKYVGFEVKGEETDAGGEDQDPEHEFSGLCQMDVEKPVHYTVDKASLYPLSESSTTVHLFRPVRR